MSEPAAPYAASPGNHTPTCAPADRPQASQAGRRCFDHACPVSEACPLYQRRHGPLCGPVACSWRYGWEYRDGLCAVALEIVLHPRQTKTGQASKVRLDVDAPIKATMDALQGVAYADDKQVIRVSSEIGYPLPDGGITVTVTQI